MKNYRQFIFSILCSLIVSMGLIQPSSAAIGAITKADLSGNWAITLIGITGCGNVSMLVNANLNTVGVGTATITTHPAAPGGTCVDGTSAALPFTITSLNVAGTGTANLSCGVGCGWDFTIQVSPDRSMFNLVDVSPNNPGNILSGMAVHKNN